MHPEEPSRLSGRVRARLRSVHPRDAPQPTCRSMQSIVGTPESSRASVSCAPGDAGAKNAMVRVERAAGRAMLRQGNRPGEAMPLEIVTVPCLRTTTPISSATRRPGRSACGRSRGRGIEAALKGKGWAARPHPDHPPSRRSHRRGGRPSHRVRREGGGAAADRRRLPALDIALGDGDTVAVGETSRR